LNKNGLVPGRHRTLSALGQSVCNCCMACSLFLLSINLPGLVTHWFLIFLNFTTDLFIIILLILKDPYWRRTISG
jgi:hypothetical protein